MRRVGRYWELGETKLVGGDLSGIFSFSFSFSLFLLFAILISR